MIGTTSPRSSRGDARRSARRERRLRHGEPGAQPSQRRRRRLRDRLESQVITLRLPCGSSTKGSWTERSDHPLHRRAPEAWSSITIGHLLTHTGGVPDWESRTKLSYRGEYSAAEFVRLLAPLPLDFKPGERFAYTTSGAPLLGIVIAAVSGMSFEHFVTGQLFAPVGLRQSRCKHQREVVPNRSGGYLDSAGTFYNGKPHRRDHRAERRHMSTAEDLRVGCMTGTGAVCRAKQRDANADARTAQQRGPFSAGIGLFLDRFRGHDLTLHNGSTVGGYSSVVYWYPDERLAVAVLMNVDRFNAVNTLATRVAGAVVPGLSTASLAERPDPDPALSRRFLSLLQAVAESRDHDFLATNLRVPGGAPRTRPDLLRGHAGPLCVRRARGHGCARHRALRNVISWTYAIVSSRVRAHRLHVRDDDRGNDRSLSCRVAVDGARRYNSIRTGHQVRRQCAILVRQQSLGAAHALAPPPNC